MKKTITRADFDFVVDMNKYISENNISKDDIICIETLDSTYNTRLWYWCQE